MVIKLKPIAISNSNLQPRFMKSLRHLDCFAGPGGICTGFKSAGIKTLGAIEKVPSCAMTYSANHPEVRVINKDIRTVKGSDLSPFVGKIDILTAGMPCETFSTAGSTSRSFYDHRQSLYLEAIRLANSVKCEVILFENVPGITSKKTVKGGDVFVVDEIFAALKDSGFKHITDIILNAVDFGVPQSRQRFFILASKKALSLTLPSKSVAFPTPVSVKDALAGLPDVSANSRNAGLSYEGKDSPFSKLMKDAAFWGRNPEKAQLSYHLPPNHRPGTIERLKLIKPGEGLKDLFDRLGPKKVKELQAKKILPNKWFIQRNRRLIATEPSCTVTSHCLDELVHPSSHRALTVREVARLQSFPDFYDFAGGPYICPHISETQDKYEQVGDAVPPLLARAWGMAIIEAIG